LVAGVLGYHSTDPEREARLCFRLKPGSYETTALIEVIEQIKAFYRGEQVVLVRDGLSAHWSWAMCAWGAEQDWLTLERGIHRINHNPQLPWSFLARAHERGFLGGTDRSGGEEFRLAMRGDDRFCGGSRAAVDRRDGSQSEHGSAYLGRDEGGC